MKKIFLLQIIILLVISFAACGADEKTTLTPTLEEVKVTKTVEATALTTPTAAEETLDPNMEVKIPDSTLRAAVLSTLSIIGKPVEGEITIEDMMALEQLVMVSPAWNGQPVLDKISKQLNKPDIIQMEDGIESLEGLQYARNMTQLIIVGNPPHLGGGTDNNLNDLNPLGQLEKLEKLVLSFNIIDNIDPISNLKNLSYLGLWFSIDLTDISAIQGLEKLTVLDLRNCYKADFSVIQGLTNLEYLYASSCPLDINLISGLTKLKHLDYNGNAVSDIKALNYLQNLITLDLAYCQINDISVLAEMGKLETVSLFSNNIDDISALADLENLKTLSIDMDTYNNNEETVEALKDNKCVIYTDSIDSIINSLRK